MITQAENIINYAKEANELNEKIHLLTDICHAAESLAEEIEQDWIDESTTYKFSDASTIKVQGPWFYLS